MEENQEFMLANTIKLVTNNRLVNYKDMKVFQEALKDKAFNPNFIFEDGNTPMHFAFKALAMYKDIIHIAILQELLKLGGSLLIKNNEERRPVEEYYNAGGTEEFLSVAKLKDQVEKEI